MAKPTGRPVKEELLTAATELIQSVGVAGFSYGDLGEQVGVRSPSIHHHFRHKEDLVAEVARRYRQDFRAAVDGIAAPTATERLHAYTALFVATAEQDRMCLCGAVIAEWVTAGEGPRREVEGFFDDQRSWLVAQLATGVADGEFHADLNPQVGAQMILATLEGAILMSRLGGGRGVDDTSHLLVSLLAN